MEICTIGGFEEVGKNMTAVKTGEDVFIFDIGLHLPAVIELQGSENPKQQDRSEKDLRRVGAIPNDRILDKLGWRDKVRAIIISHAHLDHLGGIPYVAYRYPQAEIIGSPFTISVLNSILKDDKINIRNKIRVANPNSTQIIRGKSDNYKIDFIHTTHSTIQCTFPALHTKEGIFFYGLDMKFDNYPTFGRPPNYKKMRELGRKGVKVLVMDALYSRTEKKPGGEMIAKHLLEEAFSKARNKNSALFITTFSSHIERLNNIVEFGRKTNRRIVFLGRSLNKYVNSAIEVRLCPFRKKIILLKYRNQINSFLRKVEKDRKRYLIVCTGHQAEENSILDRISKGNTPFNFKPGDNLIFSSSTIPTPANILARERMDKRLRKQGVKIQTDVHVHGHGSREDLREHLDLVKPKHIIPAHGSIELISPMMELAKEFGYKPRETSHLTSNGQVLKF
ncbi:MAG: MBL fold metallo-hydrolase [Candidatus Pacearchaeota archaeon]|jgi:ribonuclease J|nr:ribonuclease J [Candidatus Pacearchaeota archaeon]MDP7520865.1 MBL fold metallo-hydrolase [Candidatus Pacearchaeota archaeon]|tara:strand:- start:326 stop:1675 length:1350 start_codon:yes stop_codon:yes gene_type:complete